MKVRIRVLLCSLFVLGSDSKSCAAPTTNTFQINLAYISTSLEKMTQEASWFSEQLKLTNATTISPKDVSKYYIRPPRTGFGGVIHTTNYLFRFYTHRKLEAIYNKVKHDERFDLYPVWAKTPSLVDTNGAYQLATQWLAAVSVDVPALEKKYKLNFNQWFYWGREAGVPDSEWNQHPPTTNKVMMPIYDVRWGEGDIPPVKVTVFGPTKELIVLEMNDISFSKRPPIVITNWEELLNIPDPKPKTLRLPSSMPDQSQTNNATNHAITPSPIGQPR